MTYFANSFSKKSLLLPFIGIGVIAIVLANPTKVFSQDGFRVLATDEAIAPGSNLEFDSFSAPAISNTGDVVFQAGLASFSRNHDTGVFVHRRGGLSMVVLEGQETEGPEEINHIGTIHKVNINDAGTVAFSTDLVSSSFRRTSAAIYRTKSNGLEQIVRYGSPSPYPDTFFSDPSGDGGLDNFRFNNVNETAFLSGLFGDGAQDGETHKAIIVTGGLGDNQSLIRLGDAAIGAPNHFISELNAPSFGSTGVIAFRAEFQETGALGSFSAIYAERGNGLELIARHNDDISLLARPRVNSHGHIIFTAGKNSTNESLILKDQGDGPSIAAMDGMDVIGRDGYALNRMLFTGNREAVLSDSGDVAFHGQFIKDGSILNRNLGLFRIRNNELELVAGRGDEFIRNGETVLLEGDFSSLNLNADGKMAFRAKLMGDTVTEDNDYAIFAENRAGELVMVIREGEELDLNLDPEQQDLQIVQSLALQGTTGGSDGLAAGFNDLGQLAFSATFSPDHNRRAVFISNVTAVPEPHQAVMIFVGFSFCFYRRSRSK